MYSATSKIRPGRMAPISRLPVFLALDGKRAMLAGGNSVAAWKAELLSAASARVDVYAKEISAELHAVAAAPLDRSASAPVARGRSENRRRRRRCVCRRSRRDSLRRSCARGRRSAQRHRQTGILRLRLRRHCRPLAPGHWDLHRRGRAGLRPGDPGQARNAAAQGLCGLGRGRRRDRAADRGVFRPAAAPASSATRSAGGS